VYADDICVIVGAVVFLCDKNNWCLLLCAYFIHVTSSTITLGFICSAAATVSHVLMCLWKEAEVMR